MIRHVVRGREDDQFVTIAAIYGVTWQAVAVATYGHSGASRIYPWLEQNGGTRRARDDSVPTGYHWSLTSGMAVNVPTDRESIYSPEDAWDDPDGPVLMPGGPLVDLSDFGEDVPSPLPPPEYGDPGTEEPPVDPDVPGGPVVPAQAAVGAGLGTLLLVGMVVGYLLTRKPAKPKRKKRKKAKKRRRR